MDEQERTKEMDFGHALSYLRRGRRVARVGWNGKGMWVALVKKENYIVLEPPFKGDDPDHADLRPWLGMYTADKQFVPWVASQSDILANDWEVVG